MHPVLLCGGSILDGSGGPARSRDLLLADGRIQEWEAAAPAGARRLDCSGCIVAPGFIDIHSHSDLQALQGRREKLLQGVTAEVVGNCGFSAFPAAEDRRELHEFANGILCGDDAWGWPSAAQYLAEAVRPSARVGLHPLVGHGTLRIAVAGPRQGALEERRLVRMESMLAECLEEGAAGFSTGLMYAPGSSAPFEELERLVRVTARHGKLYSTHMRDYFGRIPEAIEEQLELARRTGCRLQISHLLIAGRRNWHLQQRVIGMIESAHAEGLDVGFDCYPYLAGSTVLTQILPQWALDGGAAALVARLSDPALHARIASEVRAQIAWGWEDIFISAVASGANQIMVGKSLLQIGEARATDPLDAALDLLIEERGAVNMLSFNQSEENLRQTLAHPLASIASDGFYVKGRPHPRLHGTFPHFLGHYVRERELVAWPEAIRKITSQPAERAGLADRGRIAPGLAADITVFDSAAIASPAGYTEPELPPAGIRYVIRGGEILYANEELRPCPPGASQPFN